MKSLRQIASLCLLPIVLHLQACTGSAQPDLVRLYEVKARNFVQPPVVVIHGAFGGRLRQVNSEEEIWPGSFMDLVLGDYADLKLQINPDTLEPKPSLHIANGITDRAAGRDFYGRLLETLTGAGGYKRSEPGTPVADFAVPRLYVFTYDWRQDNVESARRLYSYLQQIRDDYRDPDLKFDVIAHSMGGMLTRYFLRYGSEDVLNGNDFPVNYQGNSYVRKAVLVGTPNLGAISALRSMLSGFPVGLRKISPEVLYSFPSAYQLLPHPILPWLVDSGGNVLQEDLFDIGFWQKMRWGVFDTEMRQRVIDRRGEENGNAYLEILRKYQYKYLERGRRFVWSLTVPAPKITSKLVVFGGDCKLTPAHIVVEHVEGRPVARLSPDEIQQPQAGVDYERLMLEPGDGSVTKASLLARQELDPSVARHRYSYFPLDYGIFFCANHDQMTGDINFQDNLLNVLLTRELK